MIFGQGKTADQIARIAHAIVARGHSLLITRTDRAAYGEVAKLVPDARFHEQARIIERRARRAAWEGHGCGSSGGNF